MLEADKERVREMWRAAAGDPTAFHSSGWSMVANDAHECSPPGWVGVVELGDATVVVAPSSLAGALSDRMGVADMSTCLTVPAGARQVLGPAAEVLGPAILCYGSTEAAANTVVDAKAVRGPLPMLDPLIASILDDSSEAERGESDIDSANSGLFVALDGSGRPASVCGWEEWPHRIAHMGVLTARSHRDQGMGRAAAAAALRAANAKGLLPQWRAAESNAASRRLAPALGLKEFGRQLSFLPDPNHRPGAQGGPPT